MNNLIQKLLIFELNSPSMKIPASLALLVVLLSLVHSKITPLHLTLPSHLHAEMANVNDLTSVSNLAVNNWVLGSITQDQYFQKRFEITKNHNTSLCPLDRPFVLAHSTSCAQCPQSTPIFVLENDTCVSCPAGEIYSKDTNQCENTNKASSVKSTDSSAPNASLTDTTNFKSISNLGASNWVLGRLTKEQYDQKRFLITKTTNTSICPINAPYVLKGKTVCEDCPASAPIFSLQNDTCIGCLSGEYFDEEANQCLNKDSPKTNASQPKPVSAAPLADTTGFVYVSNLDANNWVLGSLTEDQYRQKRFEITKKHNTTLCPIETPYVLKGKTVCEQCPSSAPVFSLENDTCIGCSAGEIFNNKTNQCEDKNATKIPQPPKTSPSNGPLIDTTSFIYVSNLDASNWVLENLTEEQYRQKRFEITKKQNTTLCPIDTPYVLKGKTVCEDCPASAPIFSLERDACIGCPSGEYFDEDANQCLNKNAPKVNASQPKPTSPSVAPLADTSNFVYVSNLDANNWVLGNITQDQYHQKRFQISKKHNTTLCPLQTPYVLRGKTTCEDCPPKTPIFVLQNDTCVGCQSGQYFNKETNQCENVNQTLPSSTKNPSDTTGPLIDVSGFKNITNLDGHNWILGDITIQEYYIERFKVVHNENTTQCDIQTPYVIEGHGGICEECPIDKPIYVLANSTCIPCSNGLKWSKEQQNCTKQNETAPVSNETNATNATEPKKNETKVTTPQPVGNQTNATKPNTTQPNITHPNATQTNVTNATTNASQSNATSPKNDTKVTSPHPTTNQTNNQTQPPPKNDTKVTTPTPNKTQPEPINPPTNNTTKNDTRVTAPKPNATEAYKDIDNCDSFIECPEGQYFNYETGNCDSCQSGQFFDIQFQACLFCPQATPFLDASLACVKCPSGKSIDRKTNKCL